MERTCSISTQFAHLRLSDVADGGADRCFDANVEGAAVDAGAPAAAGAALELPLHTHHFLSTGARARA